MWPPRQGPQQGGPTTAPASRKVSTRPSFVASFRMVGDAGMTIRRRPFAFFRPFRIFAASRRSSSQPFVQEPMKTWSRVMLFASETGRTLAGDGGNAIWGSRALTSIVIALSYRAPASLERYRGSHRARPCT